MSFINRKNANKSQIPQPIPQSQIPQPISQRQFQNPQPQRQFQFQNGYPQYPQPQQSYPQAQHSQSQIPQPIPQRQFQFQNGYSHSQPQPYPQTPQSQNLQLQSQLQQLQQHHAQAQLQKNAQLQFMKSQRVQETSNSNIYHQVQSVKSDSPVEDVSGKYSSMSNDEILNTCYTTFKDIYKNRVKKTKIQSIINGEMITTDPDNIFVDTTTFDDPGFENKLKLCKLNLYPYQINTIKMVRQLELSEKYVNENGEVIHSNAFLIHLPIGSGKTAIFMFVALIYRDIPAKPIIISTSGAHIPENKMIQLKFYPYYYENVGYIEGKENCVVAIKDYIQRKMTVVITHLHLLDQLIDYIHHDFVAGLYNPQVNKIVVATSPKQIDLNCNILIVPAKPEIIERLSMLSCDQPFMRVIVDDYTNMPNIDQYRQIRATSVIFVSGSGFERDIDKIPPSYFTLRHIEVDKFSLVAKPEETSKGITRNNVITFNLVGAQNEFSMYKFVNEIDEHCLNKYSLVASTLYSPIIKNNGKLLDYLNLNFILKNYDKLNKSIAMILADISSGKLPKEKAGWLLKWKEVINEKSKAIQINRTGNGKVEKIEKEIDNPLYQSLFCPINQVPQGVQPMLLMNCSVCGKLPQEHKGWGFISSCCGSFFCSECAKAMTTRDLVIYPENEIAKAIRIHDDSHYYCVVCHKYDPTFVSNSTRNKDVNNIQTHHLVDDFMDNSDLKGHLHVDYYFKMFMEGFRPRYFDGKVIECEIESKVFDEFVKNEGLMSEMNVENGINVENENSADCVRQNSEINVNSKINVNVYKIIEQLIPKDQLALNCIERINECLKKLEIKPAKMNTIKPQLLIYGCPDYMQKRVEQYFKAYSSDPNENLYSLNILFKNSLSELIGLHQNILGILVWNNPKHIDEIQQLIGRIVRLNNWNNPVYFYITCTGGVNEKGEAVENVNNADNVEKKKLGADTPMGLESCGINLKENSGNEDSGNMLTMLKGTAPKILNYNSENKGLDFGF